MAMISRIEANGEPVQLTVTNGMKDTLELSWVNTAKANANVRMASVRSGDTHNVNTYVGHTFAVTRNSDPVATFVVETFPNERITIAKDGSVRRVSPNRGATAYGRDHAAPQPQPICVPSHAWSQVVDRVCAPTAAEWAVLAQRTAAHKAAVESRRENERRRNYLNREQPKVVPTFTKVGFEKTQVPDELWQLVQQFWQDNRHHTVNENWDLGNSYVNHWEIAPSMCYMPERLKQDVFRVLQPRIEQWAGGVAVEPTACYGIRLYHRGAKLENHVDRLDTHALSAIINVDQQVEQDWPLEIYDHDEQLHHVFLKPRDMLFYESASRIHGRPTPFNGTFYANFFVHFRPKDKWIDVNL